MVSGKILKQTGRKQQDGDEQRGGGDDRPFYDTRSGTTDDVRAGTTDDGAEPGRPWHETSRAFLIAEPGRLLLVARRGGDTSRALVKWYEPRAGTTDPTLAEPGRPTSRAL